MGFSCLDSPQLRNWMQTILRLTRFNFDVVVYSIKLRLLSGRKQKPILPAVCYTKRERKKKTTPNNTIWPFLMPRNEYRGNEEIWKFIFDFMCLHFTKRSLDRMTEYYHFSLHHLSAVFSFTSSSTPLSASKSAHIQNEFRMVFQSTKKPSDFIKVSDLFCVQMHWKKWFLIEILKVLH